MRSFISLTAGVAVVAVKLRNAKGSTDPIDHAEVIVAVAALGVIVAKAVRDGRTRAA